MINLLVFAHIFTPFPGKQISVHCCCCLMSNLQHNIAVPNAFEAQFQISNMQWDANLVNPESEVFKTVSSQVAKNVASILESIPSANGLVVKVNKFSGRNVTVVCTLWWRPGLLPNLTAPDIRNRAGNEPSRRLKFYNHGEGRAALRIFYVGVNFTKDGLSP